VAAPGLEELARGRLMSLCLGLAVLHFVLVLAHLLSPGYRDLRTLFAALVELPWHQSSALAFAFVTAHFFLVLRLLLPRLPLRWAEPLGTLAATLLIINAFGVFMPGVAPDKTVILVLAVVTSGALLFSTRTLGIVLAVALGGWTGIAWHFGGSEPWRFHGGALLGAAAVAVILQRLHRRALRQMLAGDAPRAAPPAAPAADEEKFRRWSEATFEGIAIHERGVIIEANRSLATLLQVPAGDLPGRSILDWFTRSSRDVILESVLLGNFRPFEAVARRADKSEIQLELYSKKVNFAGREVTVTAFRDITERQRAATALTAEQERLARQYQRQLALANVEVCSGQAGDVTAVFERVVRAAEEVLPARAGAVILIVENSHLALAAEHLSPAARGLCFDPVQQLARVCEWVMEQGNSFIAGNTAHDDPFGVDPGAELISAYAALPLLDGNRVVGILFALESGGPRHFTPDDIDFLDALSARAGTTLLKARLHAGLSEANTWLQQQSALLQKQNDELTRAKQLAEQASAAKSEFLAKISHELRTPMNGVIGMTDYLLTTSLTADQRESAETVRASADALLASINSILDFSCLESGRYAAPVVPFSPGEMVENLARSAEAALAGRPIQVQRQIAANIPAVLHGDAAGLHQALARLVDNAVKFTTTGSITIAASATAEDAGLVTMQFSVRDTGPGIPAEACQQLFSAFTQADGSHARLHEGLGLGLATVQRLVNHLHGQVHVSSTPGVGTEFSITVPLQPAPAASAGSGATALPTPAQPLVR
jgi:PAS domain S-box-containing protein